MSFRHRHLSLFAFIALFASLSGPAALGRSPAAPRLAQGGPDSFGYRFIDSQDAAGPVFSDLFENLAGIGTQAHGNNIDDSPAATAQIGFTFPYYGAGYTSIFILPNGNLQLTTTANTTFSNATTNPSTATPNGLIAPFWDDLHTRTGTIRYTTLGTAPNRRFIVHWVDVGAFSPSTGVTYNFQVKLYEDGRIYFLYNSMSGGLPNGSSATIGIENLTGTVGLTYHLNGVTPSGTTPTGASTAIANQRAVLIANNVAPTPPTNLQQTDVSAGAARSVGFVTDSTIYFRAAASDPDASNTVGIEAEILPATTPFQAATTGTVVATPTNALVPNGQVAEAALDFSTTALPSGNYHWRARTKDNAGATSAWVEFNPATIHFVTDFVPPTPPTGPFSPHGVQLILEAPTGPITFQWGAASDTGPPGPIDYRMELSNTDTFGTVLFETTTSNLTAQPTLTASDTPYFWRVTAIDQAGNVGSPSAASVYQQSWSQPDTGPGDRHAACGAGSVGPPTYSLALAAVAALMGLLRARRRS